MYSRLFSGFGTARNFSSIWRSISLAAAVKPRIGSFGWVRAVDGTASKQSATRSARRIIRLLYRRFVMREAAAGCRVKAAMRRLHRRRSRNDSRTTAPARGTGLPREPARPIREADAAVASVLREIQSGAELFDPALPTISCSPIWGITTSGTP